MVSLVSIQAERKHTAAGLPVVTAFGGRIAFLFVTPRGSLAAVLLAILLGGLVFVVDYRVKSVS